MEGKIPKPERKEAERLVYLSQRAKEGDEEAFSQIYLDYYAPIYRYAYFRLRKKEESEDVAQAVFLRAYENIGTYADLGKPITAWLYTIAHNLVIDHFKKKKDAIVEDPDVFFESVVDEYAQTDFTAISKERSIELLKAIEKLPEDQQEVIILHSIEDRSYEEIAHITGKNEEALRALKYRALKKLKDLLQKHAN